MSDRYFYKLSGESAERAIEFARKQEDQRKALCDFLKERHGLEENEQYYMSHGRLIGIPIKGEMPKTFKKCQTAPKFMCPRESTKEGKAIAKEWNRFLISEQPMDLLKALGLDSMQFLGRSCGFPSTLIINGAAYLYTYKSLAHPDAEEVTKGFIEGEVEAHNAKAKAKQAQ